MSPRPNGVGGNAPGCFCGQFAWQLSDDGDGPSCFAVHPEVLEAWERGAALYEWLAIEAGIPEPVPALPKTLPLPQGESLIARLKAAYRVEDLASRWTDLRGGKTLSGKCPLHNEQQGRSFTVWVDSQRWKCFGKCGIGGDVIDLARAAKERGLSIG